MFYAKLLAIPLVVSYHTHVPDYVPLYFPRLIAGTLVRMLWSCIRFAVRTADLTLVTSKIMQVSVSDRLSLSKQLITPGFD